MKDAFPLHTYDRLKRKYARKAINFQEVDKDGELSLPKKRRRSIE
jgi:hypothetical protein